MLAEEVEMEVRHQHRQLAADDGLEEDVDSWLEVVEPVEQSPDVAFERPACATGLNQSHKVVERVSFHKFPDVDSIVIINERAQNLKERGDIGQPGTHNNFFTVLILLFILLNERCNLVLNRDHNIMIAIILHNFQNLNLIRPQTSPIAVDKIPKEIQQLTLIVTLLSLLLNILTDILNQLKHTQLVV
jgi:hypothetical protein